MLSSNMSVINSLTMTLAIQNLCTNFTLADRIVEGRGGDTGYDAGIAAKASSQEMQRKCTYSAIKFTCFRSRKMYSSV